MNSIRIVLSLCGLNSKKCFASFNIEESSFSSLKLIQLLGKHGSVGGW